jgi:hypothetical protein
MKVKIINYYKNKEEKFPYKEYYIYELSFLFNDQNKIYNIRYSELEKFHENLLKKYPYLNKINFPEKLYFFNQKNINKRINDLEIYLNKLLSLNDKNVEIFLQNFFVKNTKNEDFMNTLNSFNSVSTSNSLSSLNEEIIENFLNDLSYSKDNLTKIIKEFENNLNKINFNFNKNEISLLFFGNLGKNNGLIDFMGKNVKENPYSNFSVLFLISNLIDCEFNENYEIYRSVFQLICINKVKEMNFDSFLQFNYNNITDKIFVIIRCLCENKKIEFKDCFRGNKYKLYYEMYKKWLDDD